MPIDVTKATTLVSKAATVVSSTVTQGLNGIQSALQSSINKAINGLPVQNLVPQQTVTKVESNVKPGQRLVNPLSYFSSFNYNFTLSVLDTTSLNFPNETYKKGMLGNIILSSASKNPADRIPTVYKSASNPSGSFEFYIDDVNINHVIGFEQSTANTNAMGFTAKIIEPYSMGLFFQVMQTAALAAGYKNYLDIPLLLTIEFKGHITPDFQSVSIDGTTKHYPLKLRQLSMSVTGHGAEYECDFYPLNETAYSNTYSMLKTATSVKGQTVLEMLQTGDCSLQKVINDQLKGAVEKGLLPIADQVLISFPIDLKTGGEVNSEINNTATKNPNDTQNSSDLFSKLNLKVSDSSINTTIIQESGTINHIGLASMGFNIYREGNIPFARDNLTYDENTGIYKRTNVNLEINPNSSEFRFGQGSDIINAINQVILMSDYGRTALTQISEDGYVPWWRIEPHVYFIPTDANLERTGLKPKLVVYRIVPYAAHSSVFSPPNSGTTGIELDKKQVVKEYNYIYSGNNTEILNFDITFKAGFYTQLSSDYGANNASRQTAADNSSGADSAETRRPNVPKGGLPGPVPYAQKNDGVITESDNQGGGGLETAATRAARQFQDALTSGVDMINMDLTILGDPYYLGDSGTGNYSAVSTNNRYLTADNSMNWQSGEVHILLNFRTPTDFDQSTGMINFTTTSNVPQFSGLYRVLTARSTFSKGKFTQTLKIIRLPNQDNPAQVNQLSTTPEEVPLTQQQQMLRDQEQGMFD